MSVLENLKTDRALLEEAIAARKAQIDLHTDALDAHERDLADLDKAIAALSTETEGGLLDQNPEAASPEFASESRTTEDEIVEYFETMPDDQFKAMQAHIERTDAEAVRTSDESQAEDPTIDAITAHIEAENAEPSIDAERTSESQSTDGIDRVEPQLSHQFSSDIQQALSQQEEHLEGHVGITHSEAAYAPVNEDEGLMWSNGFEADAKSKAEAEQDKRPFWTRAPKPKVNA